MKVLIQAGGKGTRLQSITGNLPKPMVRIGSKPILEWQIASLVSSGLTDITIVVAPTQNVIQEYFGDGSKFGATIHYLVEKEPLGTGGILCEAKDLLNDDFVLLFGDLMLDVDWQRMVSFHEEHKAAITAFAHPNSHPFDSDLLIADKDDRVTSLDSKHNVRNYYYENLTNAGIYIVSKTVLESIEGHGSKDFEKDILVPQIAKGNVWAYRSSEYVKDCGTPDRYEAVNRDCASGIIAKKCLRNKQKAIFLDRDGTLNVFGDFVVKAEMLFLMNDAPEAVKDINKSDYLVICITNQPVVARGETTLEELHRVHNRLEDLLGQEGAYLDDLYFCPHHPDSGFKGEVSEFKIVCDCRKPKIGMLLKAQKRYNIDLTQSWFIGDTKQDVQTGINGGCQTVLLTCGDPNPDKKYREARPTFVSDSLLRAVQKILKIN